MGVLQHRVAVGIVAVAALATAAVFTFARPEYRPPNHGGVSGELKFPEAVGPTDGWRWTDPTPGFHLGEDRDRWNISLLKPREIPSGAGILASARFSQSRRPQLIYSKRGCIGIQLTTGLRRRLCPPHAEAVVLLYGGAPSVTRGGLLYPLFVTGIARSDVARVTVNAPRQTYVDARGATPVVRKMGPQVVYDANAHMWWGTFMLSTSQPGGWDAVVTVRSKDGNVSKLRAHLPRGGDGVYCVAPSGPVSCR